MAAVTEEYRKLVLDDLNNYVGLNHPVKASILERIFVRKLSIYRLHPNPEDEFSIESIGPNLEIVGNYAKQFKYSISLSKRPIEEPLIVEKMSTGGYMLLNGHHRWMAAHRIALKYVPVQVVNVTPEDEIFATINKSIHNKCVSFDLDEVLLTDGSTYPADKKLIYPLNKIYKKSIRKNAAALIRELRELGYDVWCYTGNYYSSEYINGLMSLHNTKIDGLVNGLNSKRSNKKIKEAFSGKYEYSLHIDNESIILVNTRTKDYDSIDIPNDGINWAAEVMKHLRKFEVELKNH